MSNPRYYVLFYDYAEDVVERRQPFRADHLALVQQHLDAGMLVLAGAWADPVDGAALVFHVEDREVIEQFVARDPYVENGLVTDWRIREWTVVADGTGTAPA